MDGEIHPVDCWGLAFLSSLSAHFSLMRMNDWVSFDLKYYAFIFNKSKDLTQMDAAGGMLTSAPRQPPGLLPLPFNSTSQPAHSLEILPCAALVSVVEVSDFWGNTGVGFTRWLPWAELGD